MTVGRSHCHLLLMVCRVYCILSTACGTLEGNDGSTAAAVAAI